MPNTDKDIKELSELQKVAGNKIITPSKDTVFYVGNVKCTIVHIGDATEIDENDSSIVLEVDYGETNCLFMGDATEQVESSIQWNDIDVLKVAHHGSNSSSSLPFLEQVKPEYSIISVGENGYGHPREELLERLTKVNSTIYRTDKNGTIILVSDGNDYYFKFDKTSLDGN